MNTKASPFKISIASPCHARWEDMGGDHRVRFCDHCQKNVFNISALTAAEAAALLESKQGHLCARIYQRADGHVLTEDCPAGMARQWRRLKILISSGMATILLTLVNVSAFGSNRDRTATGTLPRPRFITAIEDVLSKLDLYPWVTMGKIRVVSPPKQVPAPTSPAISTPAKK